MIRLIICALLFLHLGACEKNDAPKTEKPIVLVSVPPYAYFVKKIAGDAVVVSTLVPVGANPHIYEPTPKEVQSHQNAKLWVRLGETFDAKVAQFFKDQHHDIQIVDVAKGIDLIHSCDGEHHGHCHHGHDEGKDLHVWLSPSLAKLQVEKIAAGLILLLPEQEELLTANLKAFLNELNDLDHTIAEMLSPMHGKAILVSHPAFGYFCRDYHLEQLSVEMEGKEPLPQQVTQLLTRIRESAVHSILLEPQYSNKGAEMIASTLGLPTHMVDPYAENYCENLLSIAKVIAE